MDFARKQLLKFGWEEGKGLGKDENGISEALKPKLKFDTAGVGHDGSEQFTFNWWENMYNKAADNVKITKSDNGEVAFGLISGKSIDITTKKDSVAFLKQNNDMTYGSFLRTSKLTAEGVVDHEDKMEIEEKLETDKVFNLTDEQLFAACGGRTAHKGARHGLKLNGKLSRIEEQEKELLKLLTGPKDVKSKLVDANGKKKKRKIQDMLTEDTNMEERLQIKSQKEMKKIESRKQRVETQTEDTEDDLQTKTKKQIKREKKLERRKHKQELLEAEVERKTQKNKRKKINKKINKITEMFDKTNFTPQDSEESPQKKKKLKK